MKQNKKQWGNPPLFFAHPLPEIKIDGEFSPTPISKRSLLAVEMSSRISKVFDVKNGKLKTVNIAPITDEQEQLIINAGDTYFKKYSNAIHMRINKKNIIPMFYLFNTDMAKPLKEVEHKNWNDDDVDVLSALMSGFVSFAGSGEKQIKKVFKERLNHPLIKGNHSRTTVIHWALQTALGFMQVAKLSPWLVMPEGQSYSFADIDFDFAYFEDTNGVIDMTFKQGRNSIDAGKQVIEELGDPTPPK